ncbi:MAG: glucose-6-phosphate isomerase [Verrucomicrobiia bacterium]
MPITPLQLWDRYRSNYLEFHSLGLALDVSRMNMPDSYRSKLEPLLKDAFVAMADLERGAIANPDEKRMVGHYWLRNPALAPDPEIREQIERFEQEVREFAAKVQAGQIAGRDGRFVNTLVIGIGGSALGPQFLAQALGKPDSMRMFFFDNTDPDGMDRVLSSLKGQLGRTLCVVISKSGKTKETRNGMVETQDAYRRAGIEFSRHAVAVTEANRDKSDLYRLAADQSWLARFPMWDWVGGRTSVTSAVGLLPAALQGVDTRRLLEGARLCDEVTRQPDVSANPAAQLASMWHFAGQGKGLKDMVIIPYKDRLELFSRYLQQLVMESLGKELDRAGNRVNQGLAVYGNKGSTDQHAYVQQLRDGIDNFFVTFVRVLREREGAPFMVESNVTSGDYLDGFLLGTRKALFDNGRQSITLTIREVSAFSLGVLIALFERAVGLYASLIGVNAYHQPGVEAGKKAAEDILSVQRKVVDLLMDRAGTALSLEQIAEAVKCGDDPETVFHILEHLTANPERGVLREPGKSPFDSRYQIVART